MALTSLGDMAQSFLLRRQSVALKSDVQRLSLEVTTGASADTAARVRGDFAPLAGIDAGLMRLTAYRSATTEAALQAQGLQSALGLVTDLAARLTPTLRGLGGSGAGGELATVARAATQALETTIAAFNTRMGDRTLFAGTTPDGPALISADALLDALETAAGSSTTAADVAAAVNAWFDDPAGYAATAYIGGAAPEPHPIAPGERADLGVTAADPAIRDTLRGLAMAALTDRSFMPLAQERKALAQTAGDVLLAGGETRVTLAARVGVAEGQIDAASARNEAEATALGIARAGLVSVDPYETATRLEAAQTQIETLHALTARVSRLSLVDFLR